MKATPLKKARYGLKKKSNMRNETLKEFMNSIGLYDNVYSRGMYVSMDGKTMITLYTDNFTITSEFDERWDTIEQSIRNESLHIEIKGTIRRYTRLMI